jgi:hypothetical protein
MKPKHPTRYRAKPEDKVTDQISYKPQDKGAWPPSLFPAYTSTVKRSPTKPLVIIPQTLSEVTGPVYGHSRVEKDNADLTKGHAGEPLGERMIVTGRILGEDGRPVPNTLVELWQCNAAGRYAHKVEGVVRPPSAFTITVGRSPSIKAMAELVVPRSIPTALLILFSLHSHSTYLIDSQAFCKSMRRQTTHSCQALMFSGATRLR